MLDLRATRGDYGEEQSSMARLYKRAACTTPAMYLALSYIRSARRIAGADGPVSNSDRP